MHSRHLAAWHASAVHRFTETANRSSSLFDAIPDGKPLTLFLELLWEERQWV
jgi:hypothetical protein